MVITARDIMTPNVQCVAEAEIVVDAARRMRDLDVDVLPVCGSDGRLIGIVTDRDIVIRCVADGNDPGTTTAGSLCDGAPVIICAEDPVEDVLSTMDEYQVRRLPVIDEDRLVGIISEADIAHHAPDQDVADMVQAVTER
jgi:CBS domain-containing protein